MLNHIYGHVQTSEDVCKTLQGIKTMLYGTPEQEPQTEHVSQLAMEMYQSNMLLALVQNLSKIEFEVGFFMHIKQLKSLFNFWIAFLCFEFM